MKTAKVTLALAIPTDDGEFVAVYTPGGLAALNFPTSSRRAAGKPNTEPDPRMLAWHRRTVASVKHILSGREPVDLPPLDLSGGTAFQHAVWQAMQRIRRGQTRSYGDIARAIGKPKAVRAVGGACGANPIPLLVPCHRVLAAGGRIGGFSGGLDWKRKLLAREEVSVRS